jgi:CheY-like chemotaxis protein
MDDHPWGGAVSSDILKKRILVVEDEPDTRIFLATLLKSGGYNPVGTEGSVSGLASALKVRPDLIILDIMLANERGIQIYRNLKADRRLKDVPVILLSAIDRKTFFHYQRFQNVFPNLGIPRPDAYLEKPPEADDLLRWVHRLTTASDNADGVDGYQNDRRGIGVGPDRASGPRSP